MTTLTAVTNPTLLRRYPALVFYPLSSRPCIGRPACAPSHALLYQPSQTPEPTRDKRSAITVHHRASILPQYKHHFQPILSSNHTIIPNPYISTPPRQDDFEGQQRCDCCTAQLSDDHTIPGLRDSVTPHIRYRLRLDQDQPSSHSNLHSNFIRIHRQNGEYHRTQRESQEQNYASTGIFPDPKDNSIFKNTPGRIQHCPIYRTRARRPRQAQIRLHQIKPHH